MRALIMAVAFAVLALGANAESRLPETLTLEEANELLRRHKARMEGGSSAWLARKIHEKVTAAP